MSETSPSPTEARVAFETPDDATLRARIEIRASPERVYAAWTRPEILPTWFGPRSGGRLQIDRFEPQVGGAYDVTMVFADGDRARMTGEYRELDPPRRIAMTWRWDESGAPSEETLVTVDLVPTETGTALTLVHARFATPAMRDQHQSGWGPLLQRLALVLAD